MVGRPDAYGYFGRRDGEEKLSKIRAADIDNLVIAVSERLDCAEEDFGEAADHVLWFKTGIHVYDVVELVEDMQPRLLASPDTYTDLYPGVGDSSSTNFKA